MILSHKIRLYPNNKQVAYFKKACGCSRFAYNWALEESKKYYEETKKTLSGYELSKRLNAIKKDSFPWMYEVTKWTPQKAVYNFADALKLFFRKTSRFPKFKKKGKCKESFYFGSDKPIKIEGKKIFIPKLGKVRLAQDLRFSGKILNVVISEKAGQWFASVTVELSEDYVYPHTCKNQDVVGVDLGIKSLAVLSNGEIIESIRSLKRYEKKLRKLNKSLSRKKKNSKRRKRTKLQLSKLYNKIASVRNDSLHKLTACLVRDFRFIGIEDLNVSGMLKSRKLSKAVSGVGFYEFRRQVEYKSKLSGSKVVVADRFFPSSKMCSSCRNVQDLKLSDRFWICESCGIKHDRDLNAAINLKNVAVGYIDTLNARGEESSGIRTSSSMKLSSVKREEDI